ncbi:MAG: hypothetical protein SPJ62_05630 [Inconstantimicrobium porci]|uniref:hypothetical protein n=1 Tax=Inconstantimicrobium porci TaxID=2652291 RepID=UPI002A90A39F|nr:hypothetical protein [Inconstantimicrobium porci]MDY5911483.1 hypothetical protein [Inconstantimicrobium porci]
MGDIKALTPGEKIKKIRKDFKIKQNEITDGKITRNLISLVENNKAELTDSTANIISSCINKICKERNIDFTITPQDLLVNNTMQADKILDELISTIKANAQNSSYNFSIIINKSEELIKKNPYLKRKTELYEELGRVFLNRNDYWNAYIFFFKAYEHLDFENQENAVVSVTGNLSFCCNILCKFSEAIQVVNTVLSLNLKISDLFYYKLTLNKALALKNLKQYMNTIDCLQTLKNIPLNDIYIFKVKTLEANCYKELQLYKDALDIQFELLNMKCAEDPTRYLIILCNIIDVYIELNNKKEIKHYLDKAMNFLQSLSDKLDSSYAYSIYYNLGKANIYLENFDDAIITLSETLIEAKENNYYKSQYDSLNQLFSIYKKREDYEGLNNLKVHLIELLNKDNRPEYHTLIYKYINMYSMQNKKDDLDSLVSFALSLNREEFND